MICTVIGVMNTIAWIIIGILIIAGVAYVYLPQSTFDDILTSPKTGILRMYLTDKPALNITSLDVTIDMIEVHKAETEQANVTPTTCDELCITNGYGSGTCEYAPVNGTICGVNETEIAFPANFTGCPVQDINNTNTTPVCCCDTATTPPVEETGWIIFSSQTQTFDLIELRDVYEILGNKSLTAGKYTQIRLHIVEAVGEINGEEKVLTVPSGKLKLIHPFYIVENQTTILTLDFDAEKSVHGTGESGKYILRPTIKVISGE
jgi:hypothetical protein